MTGKTPAQRKLVSYIQKCDPSLSDKDLATILNGIKRFVNLARRIYTEPQARVTYKDIKDGKKIIKQRIFNVDLHELAKVNNKSKQEPVDVNTFRKLHSSLVGDKKHG